MESTKQRLSKTSVIIIYLILFYTIWALNEFFGKPFLGTVFPDEHTVGLFNQIVTKNLVWTVPALLLVKHYRDEVHIPLKEMFTNRFKVLPMIGLLLLITAYFAGSTLIKNGSLQVKPTFGMYHVILYTFTGITEETVFRGWLLNATYKEEKQWQAITLTSLLFMFAHFPIWIMKGQFISIMTSFNFLFLIMLSVLFSLLFLKNKNIIPAIVVHAFYDIMTEVF